MGKGCCSYCVGRGSVPSNGSEYGAADLICPACNGSGEFQLAADEKLIITKEPIKVWRFYDAPELLQKLSNHGGDEDWLAVVPPNYSDVDVDFMFAEGSRFGCCSVSIQPLADGTTIYIGAHA